MKVEGIIFWFLAGFFLLTAPIYWFIAQDPAGTTALAISFAMAFFLAFYLSFTAKRMDPRPEDREDGEISDNTGVYGFYSPHSWWPLRLAGAAAVMFIGLVFGWWVFIIGAAMVAAATVGFVFEYYRGEHAH